MSTEEKVERLSNPDPFALARRVQQEVGCSCKQGMQGEAISYLWLYVTDSGIGQSSEEDTSTLNLDDWLNILDEAAAGGVRYMMVSILTELSNYPDLWALCQWAQDTHGIKVGVYTDSTAIHADDMAHFKDLNPELTQIFVGKDVVDQLSPLAEAGYQVGVGEIDLDADSGSCAFPGRMVFVNSKGTLYTCGKVEGHDAHNLGSAFEGRLSTMLNDPSLPHEIANLGSPDQKACNGCPPLLARHFKGIQD